MGFAKLGFDRATMALRWFGWSKVPMILFTMPHMIEASDRRCEVVIPLRYQTRNHLKSMYFGALCTGADIAGGFLAMRLSWKLKLPVSLVFKSFKCEFLKRAEDDVHFVCEDGARIAEQFQKCVQSGERLSFPVHVTAYVPKKLGTEPVARFELELSLKKKAPKVST